MAVTPEPARHRLRTPPRAVWFGAVAVAAALLALGAGAFGWHLSDAVSPPPVAAPAAVSPAGSSPAPSPVSAPPLPTPSESRAPAAEPSPTAAATPSPPLPLAGRTVALDPGHSPSGGASTQVPDGRGGTKACNTSGTATNAGYPEHAFNYDVSARVKALLEARGAAVHLSRDEDPAAVTCVDQRGKFADATGSEVLVSIHGDGNENPAVKGFFAIVSSPPLNEAQGQPSLDLAEAVLARLREAGFT
ncbi:MAG: N-acetylmuramoyl-L-alanine amidase, partial [Bifidobacteriaceae bacterium]|nr:N-acetylmuramoyl-L-alanine amidase [Bifidobacteriaceae bacterium]